MANETTKKWVRHPDDERWLMWEEQLAPEAWLIKFERPFGDEEYPHIWINIYPEQWSIIYRTGAAIPPAP